MERQQQGYALLLRQALDTLGRLGYNGFDGDGTVSVRITAAGGRVRLTFREKAGQIAAAAAKEKTVFPTPERPGEISPGWLWLSPLEEEILRAVNPTNWVTAERIAADCGGTLSTEFRAVLKNLVERGILVSAQSRGYRLNLPAAPGQPAS